MFNFFKRKKRKPEPEIEERTPLTIQVGDIVSYDGTDYEVVQKLTYRQGGYTWYDYQLQDGKKTLWLGAEDDDGLCVAIYREIRFEFPQPLPDKLQYRGTTFYLDERGSCLVKVESQYSTTEVQVQYWDYESEEEDYLSIENWSGDWDASYGEEIEPFEIEIYPRVEE